MTREQTLFSIDFQGHVSKVKVIRWTLLLNLVNTIQTEPFQLWLSNLVCILLMTRGRHLLISKVKGQGHTLHIVVKPCKHDTVLSRTVKLVVIMYWWQEDDTYGSVPVDFLRPKFRVAHTKDDVISFLMHIYTNTNMYIIKKIISCRFILFWDITSLLKPYEKSCWRRKVKIEKILTVTYCTYRTLLTKTTNFPESDR